MPSTFSQSLRLELIGTGEKSGTWGVATNNNLGDLLEQAIVGVTSVDVTLGNVTLTSLNGVTDQARSLVLSVIGTPGTTRIITIPNAKKPYTVKNTSDSTVQVKTAAGVAYNCPAASESYIYCNGANVISGRTITDGANTILSNPTPYNSPAFTGVPTAPTAVTGTNTTQIATTAFVQTAANLAVPSGVVLPFGGVVAPSGYLLCNGQLISRVTYAALFAAIGTAYGVGDGSTTFAVPNMQDRFPVGAGSSYAVGATGGSNTVSLTEAQMPAHSHAGTTNNTDVAHTHTFTSGNQSADHTHSGSTAVVNIDHTHTGTTGNQSNDHSHSGTTASENQNHTHGFSGGTSTAGAHQHGMFSGDNFGAGGGGNPDAVFNGDGGPVYLGNTGTAGDHSHSFSGTTSGISNNHQHAFSTGGVSANHTHNITTGGMNSNASHSHAFTSGVQSANHTHSGTTDSTSITHNHTFGTDTKGSGAAHENRPPYLGLTFIIKA